MPNKYIPLADAYLMVFRNKQYDDSLSENIDKIIREPLEGLNLVDIDWF